MSTNYKRLVDNRNAVYYDYHVGGDSCGNKRADA